jgi:nitric oxide reductase activation protein
VIDYCPTPEDEDGLSPAESDEVERLVTEELRKEDIPVKMPNGSSFAEVFVTKPVETSHSRSLYIGKPNPHLAKLKAALLFRQELPQYTNRLQKEGGLDEEELWRWSAGDYRLFEEKVIAVHPKVQMSLLVDLSGSMVGRNLNKAQELAQLFVWALKDMQNVTTKVFGHTANITGGRDCQVYRLWDPGDPLSRLGLIGSLPHCNNYDGFAIASVAKELSERGEPDEQRVLIVLADGYPSGSGYGGDQAFKHVKSVDDWARKHGVEVIQIAIDSDLDAARQSAMFKQWIPFTDTSSLPHKLEALLAKLT